MATGPRYLGPTLLGVAFSLLAVSTIFVALRFYCRQFIVRKIGTDDWIILVALVSFRKPPFNFSIILFEADYMWM